MFVVDVCLRAHACVFASMCFSENTWRCCLKPPAALKECYHSECVCVCWIRETPVVSIALVCSVYICVHLFKCTPTSTINLIWWSENAVLKMFITVLTTTCCVLSEQFYLCLFIRILNVRVVLLYFWIHFCVSYFCASGCWQTCTYVLQRIVHQKLFLYLF